MKKHIALIAIPLGLLTLGLQCYAQAPTARSVAITVNLKDGQPQKGKLLRVDPESVELENAGLKVSIPIDKVASIVFGDSPDSAAAARACLKSLKALLVALDVGVNIKGFEDRLIDVKILIEDNLPNIGEGELKVEIATALKQFEFAAKNQRISIEDHSVLSGQEAIDRIESAKKHVTRIEQILSPPR